MTTGEEAAAVRAALGRLELAVMGLREAHGDTLGTRRLVSDVRRLADDLNELGEPGRRLEAVPSLEEIPDTPYDRSMWADAEDEGFGAPDRHAP